MNKLNLVDDIKRNNILALDPRTSQDKLISIGAQLATLHAESEIDSLSYFESLDWANFEDILRYQKQHILRGLVEKINAPTERLYSFFHNLAQQFPETFSHIIFETFNVWASNNLNQLKNFSLLLETTQCDSPFVGGLIFHWHEHDKEAAFNAAITFAKDTRPILKTDATRALGVFRLLTEEQFKCLESCLTTQVLSDSDGLVCAAVYAIKKQISFENHNSTVLMTSLYTFASNPTTPVRAELIRDFSKLRLVYTEELQTRIIALMKTVKSGHKELLSRTDYELSKLDVTADKHLIFEVLTAILTHNINPPSFDYLGSITLRIQSSPDKTLGWYISQWLLHGNYAVCKQVNSLFSSSRTQPYTFDISEFDLTDQQLLYFSRKIFAYLFFQNNVAVSLLCECLRNVKLSSRKILEKDIASFWLRNYRDDLKLFEEISVTRSDETLRKSIERIRKIHNVYLEPLTKAPSNLAFHPSTNERSIQIELNQEQSQAMFDEIKSKSPLLSLLPNSIVLYGSSCVNYSYSHESEEPMRNTIQMNELRTTAKIPCMSILCPTRLTKIMNLFREERFPQ